MIEDMHTSDQGRPKEFERPGMYLNCALKPECFKHVFIYSISRLRPWFKLSKNFIICRILRPKSVLYCVLSGLIIRSWPRSTFGLQVGQGKLMTGA